MVFVASLLVVKQRIDGEMGARQRDLYPNGHKIRGVQKYYKQNAEFPVSDGVFIAGYPTSVVERALRIVSEVQNALERGENFEVRLVEKRKD